MDYVFFGFSSICAGLSLLLMLILIKKEEQSPHAWHIVAAGAAAFLYYWLEVTAFRESLSLYYLSNILPQGILLFLISALLLRKKRDQKR